MDGGKRHRLHRFGRRLWSVVSCILHHLLNAADKYREKFLRAKFDGRRLLRFLHAPEEGPIVSLLKTLPHEDATLILQGLVSLGNDIAVRKNPHRKEQQLDTNRMILEARREHMSWLELQIDNLSTDSGQEVAVWFAKLAARWSVLAVCACCSLYALFSLLSSPVRCFSSLRLSVPCLILFCAIAQATAPLFLARARPVLAVVVIRRREHATLAAAPSFVCAHCHRVNNNNNSNKRKHKQCVCLNAAVCVAAFHLECCVVAALSGCADWPCTEATC